MPSGDRSANPATYGVPGRSDLQRAHISVSSARKHSGADMLATPSGVSRAASLAFSCRCAVPGYRTCRSDYTRGQSPETGSLSRHLVVWEPLPSVSHRVLPCRLWFYQSSLPRRWRGSEDSRFNRRLRLRQSWCPLHRTYEGRPRWGKSGVHRNIRCPSLLSALRRSACQPCHIRCSRVQRSPASTHLSLFRPEM